MKHRFMIVLAALCSLLASSTIIAQNKVTVTGIVTDAQTSEPVVGAIVMQKGTSNAVMSDADGKYTVSVDSNGTLVCTCLGYSDAEEVVYGRAKINFALKMDNQMLEETVVVGYGTLKKSQLVGSVESISGEAIEDRVTSDVTRSLQGQVPGLNIIQTDGKPTHGGKIYVRGGSTSYVSRGSNGGSKTAYSIGQGGSALVLIDGVEGDLSHVNPEDVESVSVLKDASSSVIYGAKAAYGVILVTTKNSKNEKVSISYNGSYSINQRTVQWEDNVISDGLTYVETFYDHWLGYTATPTAEGSLPTKMNIYTIPSNYLELYKEHMANGGGQKVEVIDGGYVYFGYNENYLEKFYKETNGTQTHNMSISGSSNKVSYNISGRYYAQDGIYKIGNEDYDAYNFRSKINVKMNDWLSFDNNTSMYKMKYTQPLFSKGYSGGIGSQLWQIAMAAFPVIPTHNEDGTYTSAAAAGGYAGFADGNSGQVDDQFTFTTSLGLTVEPIKDVFKVRGDVSYKYALSTRDRFVAPVSYSTAPGTVIEYAKQTDSFYQENVYNKRHITANVVATWTPKLGENHQLNVVGGWNLEDYNYFSRTTRRLGMVYPAKPNFELMDGEEVTLADTGNSYGQIGVFARANYSLLQRYIIEISGRYDGSSRFPANQQWGFFPSASFGWRISEEPWMEGAEGWLDNLKIRANAGSLGNGTIEPYTFLTTMGIGKTNNVFDGAFISKADDPAVVPDNLTWETVTTYDVGLDMDIFQNRLSLSADYYIRNTDNLFVTGPEIPAVFGASTPKGNYGALQTKGWELTLAWKDQFMLGSKPLNYSLKASLWDSRTWVTKYYNESGGMFNLYEGKELGELWGFRTDGYFLSNEEAAAYNAEIPNQFHNYYPASAPFAGDIKFVDVNDDKKIDTGSWTIDDHGDLERIGNEMPRYQFGFNLDFRWNGIGLSAFIQGVGKRDWYPSQGSDFFWGSYARAYVANVLKDQAGNKVILDKSTENWTVTNPDAFWPRPTYGTANNEKGALSFPNDYFLMNAAYVRLKNLTLDYTFSGNWLQKAKIQKLRLYLTGENLFTWSPMFKYTSMFDPEVIANGDSDFTSGTNTSMGDGYSYPMLRTFTIGVNITL